MLQGRRKGHGKAEVDFVQAVSMGVTHSRSGSAAGMPLNSVTCGIS